MILILALVACTGVTDDTHPDSPSLETADSTNVDQQEHGLYFPVAGEWETPSHRYFPLTAEPDGQGTVQSLSCSDERVHAWFLKEYILNVQNPQEDDPRRIDPPFTVYPDEDYTLAVQTDVALTATCTVLTSEDNGDHVYTVTLIPRS